MKTRVKSHLRNKDHIVGIISTQHFTLHNVVSRPKKPQACTITEAIHRIHIAEKHKWCTNFKLQLVKGKSRRTKSVKTFWLDILILLLYQSLH